MKFILFTILHVVHGNPDIFITPSGNTTCPAHPCVTLSEYARDLNLLTTKNSTVFFLPGEHHLDIVVHLKNVSNIRLMAFSDIEYNNVRVLFSPSAYFKWTTSNNVEINGIIFIVPSEVSGTEDGCSVLFSQDSSSLLSNLTILGNNKSQSTAICISDSSQVTISFMLVRGVTSFKGAAIHAVNSTINFMGRNVFDSSSARNSSGGAGVLDNCTINVIGSVVFTNNTAAGFGGALVLNDSIWNVYGSTSFFNNSALTHGGAVVLNDSDFFIYGNASFINNTVSPQNESAFGTLIGGGGIHCAKSRLYFSRYTLFQYNLALGNYCVSDSQIQAQGGAISAYNSWLTFENMSNSVFTENNSTHVGGAVSISANSTLIMHRGASSIFSKNFAFCTGGGAIYEEGNSMISCYGESESIVFEYNEGYSGGAIYANSSNVLLVEIMFVHNHACYGGALEISQSFAQVSSSNCINNSVSFFGGAMSIDFQSTVVINGTEFVGGEAFVGGALIVWITSNNVTFCGVNNFLKNDASSNKGGAIYASDSSTLNMRGIQNFIKNIAHNGGALTISDSTKLILGDVSLNFIENHATGVGGAIYLEDTNSIIHDQCRDPDQSTYLPECFLELSSAMNVELINFSLNSAEVSGSILYGGYLDMCRLSIGGIRDSCGNKVGGDYVKDPLGKLKNISYITSDANAMSEFSSKPHKVCICDKINKSKNRNEKKEIKLITGMEISIYVTTIGRYKEFVPSSVQISPNNDVQVSSKQHVQKVKEECTQLDYQLLSNVNSTMLLLQLEDTPCRDSGISLNITFLPCPNGFILNRSTMKCACDKRLQQYTTDCGLLSVNTNYIQRESNTFWMGALYDNGTYKGLILHAGCPFDYCVGTAVNMSLDDLDVQCNNNHSGTLCGSCKHNHSIVFGTLNCIPCSNIYITLIVPFAFAGIVLVAILLLLNLSVASGMINSLIFYANIIQANRSAFFPSKEHSDVLMIFIAWINLDLGIETCFYDGMTIYAFTWLQFLFPFYVWFLVALIILLSRFSDRVANSLGSNPVATLATLLLLSYSKILRSIIAVFTVAKLEYPDGTYKRVWLYDGSVSYFQRSDHIVLGTFAIIISLFLFLPYTLLLFCGHWFQACSHRWMFSWLNRIKPLMDAYHAPYKKHTRFWIGLSLLVRCTIFLVSALNTLGNNKLTLLVIISITVFLTTLAWIYHQVYEKFYNDLIEASFILNLSVLAAGTYHIENSGTGGNQAGLSYTCVGIAFAAFICILIYHIYQRLLKISALKAISDAVQGLYNRWSKSTDTDDKQERAGPTTSSIKLLESLLDSKISNK